MGATDGGRGDTRARAPALTAAGALVCGTGVATLVDGSAPVAAALHVITLGVLAVLRGHTSVPRAADLPLVLALVLVAALGALGRAPVARGAPGTAHLLLPSRRPERSPETTTFVAWAGTTRTPLRLTRGTALAGDVLVPLELERPRWAQAPDPGRGRGRVGDIERSPVPATPRADACVRVAAGAPPRVRLRDPGLGLRARGLEAVRGHPTPVTRGLFAGLLFGETAGLPRGLSDLFTRTGTRHMLALSGLHVGLVGVLVARPFGRALAAALGALASLTWAVSGSQRRVRIDAAWPTAALALFFVPLAGYGAPASRAAVALALVVLGPRLPDRVFGGPRRPSAENLIGVALVIELLVDPRAPLTPGVQLSYVATMALVLCGGAATTKIGACVPGLGPVAATTRTGRRRWPLGRALVERARFGVAAALAASLVASFATLPTVWTTFGEYAPVGLVATPVVFLPMAALVAVGWAYAVSPAGTWLEGVLGAAADGAAGAMVALLSAFDRLPLSPCVLPDRGLPAVAIFSALALVALGARRAPAGAARLAVLSSAVLIAPRPWASRPDGLEVYVTDVGDGLAVLLNTGDGSALLLDAGSRDRIGVATEGVTPLLRALDVGRLDLVLSHDHADHARDLGWIARRFGPTRWVGDRPSPTAVDGYGEDALAGARHVRVHGDRVRASGGKARLRVDALRGGAFAGNEGSLVLDVRWDRSVRIVLCGDAEGHGLAALLRTPDLLEHGPIDALLLPHHGSDSPHLGALLDRLEPREVWISSSSPAPPALPECERRRIPSRVTGRDGPFRWSPGIPGISPLRVSNVGSRGNP